MTLSHIGAKVETFGAPGLGMLRYRVQKDKWDNDVSLIDMPSGDSYRMVHHTPAHYNKQRATIYRSDRKYVRVEYYFVRRDTEAEYVRISAYEILWGDGDCGGVISHTAINLDDLLQNIGDNVSQFGSMLEAYMITILNVLFHAGYSDAIWLTKETEVRTRA